MRIIMTHELIECLKKLHPKDAGPYWVIEQKEKVVQKVTGHIFDEKAYREAEIQESLSDRMFDRPVRRETYEKEIYGEERTLYTVYTLDLARYLETKNYLPVINKEFIQTEFSSKGFSINFEGCTNILELAPESNIEYEPHLRRDLLDILNRVNPKNISDLARAGFRKLLSALEPTERDRIYSSATSGFRKMITELFPTTTLSQDEKRRMASLQKSKASWGTKPLPKRAIFWDEEKAKDLENLEKRHKPDDEEPSMSGPGSTV